MDKEEINFLVKRLPDLIVITDCNTLVLAELKSRNVISYADEATLIACKNSLDKSKLLLEILMTRKDGFQHLLQCLTNTNQTGAVKVLQTFYNSESQLHIAESSKRTKKIFEGEDCEYGGKRSTIVSELPISHKVNQPCENFVGRSTQLDFLANTMEKDYLSHKIAVYKYVVCGLGGVGKSEFLRMFINKYCFFDNRLNFKGIFWLNAESCTILSKEFKVLATDKLGILSTNSDNREKEISSIIDEIYCNISKLKPLIIFDNVQCEDFIREFLPNRSHCKNSMFVTIISQDGNWRCSTQIQLESMKKSEAIEMMKKGIQLSNESEYMKLNELVLRLGCFPLALSQALAYINHRQSCRSNYGPGDYLQMLDKNHRKLGKLLNVSLTGTGSSYKKTTYETVDIAFRKIEKIKNIGSIALKIIKVMAYICSDNIPDKIFKGTASQKKLEDAFSLLKRYFLINFSKSEVNQCMNANVHRLVQDVVRIIVENAQEETHVLQKGLELLANNIDQDSVDHAVTLWAHTSERGEIEKKFCDFPLEIPRLMIDVLRIGDAFAFADKVYDRFKCMLTYKDNVEKFLYLELIMGVTIVHQAKYERAVTYLQDKIQKAVKHVESNHDIVLEMKSYIAFCFSKLDKATEALSVYKEVHNLYKLNGAETISSLEIYLNIGTSLLSLQKFDESLNAFNHAVKHIKLLKNIEPELIVKARCLLAITKGEMGDVALAVNDLKDILKEAKCNLHPSHLLLDEVGLNLATYLYWTGNFEDAMILSDDIYEKFRDALCSDNKKRLESKALKLCCMKELGEIDKAERLSQQVYHKYKITYGEKYSRTQSILGTIGTIYYKLGRHSDALKILKELTNDKNYTNSASNLEKIAFKYYICKCLEDLGENYEAFKYCKNLVVEVSCFSDAFFVKQKINESFSQLQNIS